MKSAQYLHFSTFSISRHLLTQTKLLFVQSQQPVTSMLLYKAPHRLTEHELMGQYMSAIRNGLFNTLAPTPISEDVLLSQTEDVPCSC
jgi:hypothetical protein